MFTRDTVSLINSAFDRRAYSCYNFHVVGQPDKRMTALSNRFLWRFRIKMSSGSHFATIYDIQRPGIERYLLGKPPNLEQMPLSYSSACRYTSSKCRLASVCLKVHRIKESSVYRLQLDRDHSLRTLKEGPK